MVCPNDYDLNEISIEAPGAALSHNQLLVERVIFKTFTQYKCDVVITDRLRSLFTNELMRMGRALQKQGGRGRADQIEKWKKTTWSLVLEPNKIIPRSNKRKAENIFVQTQVKKTARLQENLKSYQQSLNDVNIKLQKATESTGKTPTTYYITWS